MKKKIKKIFKIFGIEIVAVLSMFFVGNLLKFCWLKNESEKARNVDTNIELTGKIKSIDLVGLLDSYGVAYSPNVSCSFMDYLEAELKKQNKLGKTIDLYNLYINKTWEVNGIFNNLLTFGEMTTLKNFSLDFTRDKYTANVIKEDLKYECTEGMQSIVIRDYFETLENPCVIYSCSANDLFYYYGVSLESLTISKCIEIIENFDNGTEELKKGIKSNIDTIIKANNKSQIFVMGLYLPSDNYFLQSVASRVVDKINWMIRSVCLEYDNCYFVDVSCVSFHVLENDFHPNSDGQRIIANILAEVISENYKSDFVSNVNPENKVEKTKKGYHKGTVSAEKIVTDLEKENLRRENYVEWAVAIEKSLNNLYPEGVTYKQMEEVKNDIIKFSNKNDRELIEKALNIVISEYKIFYGIDESSHSLHPEIKVNDKLGLIKYYK